MNDFWHDLPRPFFILAPMEAVTDVVFRHVITEAGRPDIYFTEFTNATGWAHAGDKAIGGRLVKTDDENPIVAQLWGADPSAMAKLAAHCATLGYDGIDINMGCPDSSAVKSGGGAGMILTPENAAAMIASAKTSGLPVSVKTRLGYSRVDEWRDWLSHILHQDITNLTIHLRTKKEMSKVPAHYELIADIKQLRDQIAPQTLLTINGDIRDRAHGLELVEQYGVDGVMIGRGIFHNPFAFTKLENIAITSGEREAASDFEDSAFPAAASQDLTETSLESLNGTGKEKSAALHTAPARVAVGGAAPAFEEISDFSKEGADRLTGPADSDLRGDSKGIGDDGSGVEREDDDNDWILNQVSLRSSASHHQLKVNFGSMISGLRQDDGGENTHKARLLALLHLHLSLHDQYSTQLSPRKYEPLKRFYKIYIRDFPGASELRDQLMHTSSTSEARTVLANFNTPV